MMLVLVVVVAWTPLVLLLLIGPERVARWLNRRMSR